VWYASQMVRREAAAGWSPPGGTSAAACCTVPAGASPVPVSAGAPGSRPQVPGEIPVAQAGRRKPLRREQGRGPQRQVKPTASTEKQSGSRAAHVTAKATSRTLEPERVRGPGGVRGAARDQGTMRNTRGPSAPPSSRQGVPYKPKAKAGAAQRASEGVVVPSIVATNNATGGKGPCFGHARGKGKREGMAGRSGPNHPDGLTPDVQVREPGRELWAAAKRCPARRSPAGTSARSDVRPVAGERARRVVVHALQRRPSVSRVREIRTHGLKGGPTPSPRHRPAGKG
jgi:hypothetical protein